MHALGVPLSISRAESAFRQGAACDCRNAGPISLPIRDPWSRNFIDCHHRSAGSLRPPNRRASAGSASKWLGRAYRKQFESFGGPSDLRARRKYRGGRGEICTGHPINSGYAEYLPREGLKKEKRGKRKERGKERERERESEGGAGGGREKKEEKKETTDEIDVSRCYLSHRQILLR